MPLLIPRSPGVGMLLLPAAWGTASDDPAARLARPVPTAPQGTASFSGRVWGFPGTDLPPKPFFSF